MVVQFAAAVYDAASEMVTDPAQSTASMVRARPAKRRKRARALLALRVRGALTVGMVVRARALLAPHVCGALKVGMDVPRPARLERGLWQSRIEWTVGESGDLIFFFFFLKKKKIELPLMFF